MKKIIMALSLILLICSCVQTNRQKVVFRKPENHYVKPQTSKDVMLGEKIKFQLWYDKDKWEVVDKGHPWHIEVENLLKSQKQLNTRVIVHKFQEVYCFVREERLSSSFESISNIVHLEKNVTNEEIRKVNGRDVLYIKGYVKRDSPPGASNMVALAYYLTNIPGTLTVLVTTGKNQLIEYESEIFDLLNGLVDPSIETPPTTAVEKQTDEDIESKLIKLENMQEKGLITQEDYDKSKDKLLNKYSLKSAIHSDVRVLPVSSGVPNLMQSSKTYPVNGTWKISGIEQDGKYVEAKFKDELFFIFNENSFDLLVDGKFLSYELGDVSDDKLVALDKISYSVKNGKITLSNPAGEKFTANIEFFTPTSVRISNFKATRIASLWAMSIKAALTGELPFPAKKLTKNTTLYFLKQKDTL